MLPNPWRPGIKVKITWEIDGKTFEREVDVPEYDAKTAAKINAHFLRNGEAKAFVTRMDIFHPDYPFKGEDSYLKPGRPNVRSGN